ncbi:MAG: hypothetical protein M1822_003301 [Bathelium mastoideum]|nr:MAG: hypothetical protein M1822_003301 [Bathelium mastoideum]
MAANKDPFSTREPLGAKLISKSDPTKAKVEIWFVHGLTGNRVETWTHKNKCFWPELIAADFPDARVITYGYDANVIDFSKSWANAEQSSIRTYGEGLVYALRNFHHPPSGAPKLPYVPTYIIAHSLGGLVVEQALLLSTKSDQTLHEIAANVGGILLMGTPHQGSEIAKWGVVLRKLIPTAFRSTNKQVLEALKERSEVGRTLQSDFQQEAKHGKLSHITLVSFYETKIMPNLKRRIVEEESAILPADFKVGMSGDHVSMVRFTGADDSEYVKVRGQLTALLSPNEEREEVPDKPRQRGKARKPSTSISQQGVSIGKMTGGTLTGGGKQTAVAGDWNYRNRVKNYLGHDGYDDSESDEDGIDESSDGSTEDGEDDDEGDGEGEK